MNVLVVTSGYPPEHSGSGRRLHETYLRLNTKRPELCWTVLTRRRECGCASPNGPSRIYIVPASKRSGPLSLLGGCLREWGAVRRLLSCQLFDRVDLVHCAGFTFLSWFIIRAARARGIPIIRELTSFGDCGQGEGFGGRLFAALIRKLNASADLLIAISPRLGQSVCSGTTPVPMWVRPNPVDLSRFRLPHANERRIARSYLSELLPNLTDTDPVIFQLGRIWPLKNQLLTVQALHYLPSEFRLVLAGPCLPGDIDYLERIRREGSEVDLAGRVVILSDYLPDPEYLYRGADILAFPSTHEGLGNVMLEALCCGLPVVASRIDGVTDWIVQDGVNGHLCERTAISLARALNQGRLLLPQREAIASAAAERFGASILDERFWELMKNLLRNERLSGVPLGFPKEQL